MFSSPERTEINEHTGKMIVGVIALLLALVTNILAGGGLDSISEAYHRDGMARDVFVGSLLAISAFLATYNGHSNNQMILAKIAAIAAVGIALFPCECGDYPDVIPKIHGIASMVMFLVLAFFCKTFYHRAKVKGHQEAILRSRIYFVCGSAIAISILVLVFDGLGGGVIKGVIPNLVFIGEAVGLVAFGVAWLTASRVFIGLTNSNERIRPFS